MERGHMAKQNVSHDEEGGLVGLVVFNRLTAEPGCFELFDVVDLGFRLNFV